MTTEHESFKIPPCPYPEDQLKDNECILGQPLYGRKTHYDLFVIGGKRPGDRSAIPAPVATIHRVTLTHSGLLFSDVTATLRLVEGRTGKIIHQDDWVLKTGHRQHQMIHSIGLSLLTKHLYQIRFKFEDTTRLDGHYLHALTAADF